MVRARHRNALDIEELIEPGAVVEYRIQLGATACRFARGHHIRLEVTSSDFPNHDRNHNVGRNDLEEVEMARAEQRVLHGKGCASRLLLPVQMNEECRRSSAISLCNRVGKLPTFLRIGADYKKLRVASCQFL